MVNVDVASSNNFRDIKKIILRRHMRPWRRRTSTIALSENAFALRLKTITRCDHKQFGIFETDRITADVGRIVDASDPQTTSDARERESLISDGRFTGVK